MLPASGASSLEQSPLHMGCSTPPVYHLHKHYRYRSTSSLGQHLSRSSRTPTRSIGGGCSTSISSTDTHPREAHPERSLALVPSDHQWERRSLQSVESLRATGEAVRTGLRNRGEGELELSSCRRRAVDIPGSYGKCLHSHTGAFLLILSLVRSSTKSRGRARGLFRRRLMLEDLVCLMI